MGWKDIAGGILDFAPTIAKCLGVPGLLADGAATALKGIFNLGSEAGPAEVQAELAKLSPEQYVKLREADTAYKDHILSAGVNLEQIAAQDRDSARKMQTETGSWVPGVLMMLLTVGFFGLLILMWWKAPAEGSRDLLNTMVGVLGTAWLMGVTFYFGSSQGSDKLKNMVSNMKGAFA